MRTHAELVKKLAACRGAGRWDDIARVAGVSYFTLSRIATGRISNPGIKTCEALFDALEATAGPRRRAAGARK